LDVLLSNALYGIALICGLIGMSFLVLWAMRSAVAATAFSARLDTLEAFQQENRADIRELRNDLKSVWETLLIRGKVELTTKGLGVVQSPLEVHDGPRHYFDDVLDDLFQWFNDGLHGADSDADLALGVIKRFGPWIDGNICVRYGISMEATSLIAVAILRDFQAGKTVERPGDDAIIVNGVAN
jgi:hypothetical protein